MPHPRRPRPAACWSPRYRRIAVFVAAALVVGAALPVAAGAKRETSKRITVEGKPLPASNKVGTVNDPAIGMAAPTVIGRNFNSRRVELTDEGQPRILVFLAHWCPHCQAEVPRIVSLAAAGGLDGVQVQAVATNTNRQLPNFPPSKWLKREGWPFKPVLADDASSTAFGAFGGDAFPFFVFVDADGLVAGRAVAELSKASLRATAANLVAGEPLEGLSLG